MKGLVRRYKERKEKFRFVTIAPGVIDTWLCGNPKENPVPKEFLERIALGRIGKPEEVARLVRHIVENEFLNGCVIEINGGKV
jgi:3-oxoacyl-[acyl-carrier protein] reductase